jgi:hypothetical protein
MSLTRIDFENLSEGDLQTLQESEVGEGILLDYKRELYGSSDFEKKEFLKDVSSFANTAGGHIIIGIVEDGGLPTEIIGLDANLDAEKLRLENLLRDRMEPRIVGIRMLPVPLANGRRALVIRIPKSWNPPHAVLQNRSRLVYARNSAGVHEASVDEMRTMFTAGAALLERAHEFQRSRMAEIQNKNGPFSNLVGEGGRMVLHIIPFSAFGSESALDPRRLNGQYLPPIWCSGYNQGYNLDGYWTHSENPSGYVQVFRNGIIKSAAGDVRSKGDRAWLLYASDVENQIPTKVENYMSALAHAEISPPMLVMLAGVRMNETVVSAAPLLQGGAQPLRPNLLLPVVTLENYGSINDYRQALKPIFDAVWNAAGCEASPSYVPGGRWQKKSS